MIKVDRILGTRELDANLKAMAGKDALRIVGGGLRAGARLIQSAAQANAPVRTGALQRNVKIRPGKNSRGETQKSVIIGVGRKWFTGDQFYAAFVEFGHRQGRRKLGNKRKQIPGEHYIKHTFEEKGRASVDAIVSTIRTLIAKEYAKVKK